MRGFIAGFAYTFGVVLIGQALHLKWLTGLGIWFVGFGFLLLIGVIVND
jgi:hypothetical protein